MKISVQIGDLIDLLGFETGYAMVREAGFDGIDWHLDHAWNPEEVKKGQISYCILEEEMDVILQHFAQELSIIKQNGLQITQAHAPYPSFVAEFPEIAARVPRIYDHCISLLTHKGIYLNTIRCYAIYNIVGTIVNLTALEGARLSLINLSAVALLGTLLNALLTRLLLVGKLSTARYTLSDDRVDLNL